MPVATVEPFRPGRSGLARLVGATSPASVQPSGSFQQMLKKPSWMKLFRPSAAGASQATARMQEGATLSPDDIQELMIKKQAATLNRVYQR